MIRRLIYTALSIAALSLPLVSCSDHDFFGGSVDDDGMITLRFSADVPDMTVVDTRAVDPDGGGVQNMTLFCFDSYGLFITSVTATVTAGTPDESDYVLSGAFTATVPDNTRTIHFVANQNMDDFPEDNFRNKSESEVMGVIEGSSGRMLYWARFACNADDDSNIMEQMEAQSGGAKITMIRNQAHISVSNPTSNDYLTVTGIAVANTYAFGTVAPRHPDKGYDFTWSNDGGTFVTLPVDDSKLSDIGDVTTDSYDEYVYESENRLEDPVSVIIRGYTPGDTEELYYRVMLVDENGDQLLVCRNHHYRLNITGALSYGQTTFDAALTSPATNNVWVAISDDINAVSDGTHTLEVEQTTYVLSEAEVTAGNVQLKYTLTDDTGGSLDANNDKPDVTWTENNVATQTMTNTFTVSGSTGNGTITIHPLSLGSNDKLEGTLLVKYGRLQRRIKIISVKQMDFTPAWVGTQVYGGIDQSDQTKGRSHVTLMFTIPETCPEELFPMKVYLSVNDLDVRSEAGIPLSVVSKGDENWYGDDNEWGYKYVYEAEAAGVQRVYFENILNQDAGESGTITIEAPYFDKMTREFTFSDSRKSITVEGLTAYSASGGGADGFSEDELILYRLVPQKINANVQFDLQLRVKTGDELDDDLQGEKFNAEAKDEFLLYSQNLDYYLDGDESKAGVTSFDCTFYPNESDTWWRANNPDGGRMLMFKPRSPINPEDKTGMYSIYMYTNKPKSAEVIRIASNLPGYDAILTADAGDDGKTYAGNSYRSVTFELFNNNPFRFAARVNDEGTDPVVSDPAVEVPENVDNLTWTYDPNKEVDITLDITSFQGTDGKSADPFGTEFEIYIDAPMLEIDAARLSACKLNSTKLREDPTTEGRFIYTVAANRATERSFGTGTALKSDATSGVDQSGERKTLPFKVKSIVSAGNITISSDESKVVFFEKTFRVSNSSITGTLTLDDGTKVPKGAFVAFERVSNAQRIGVITVTAEGEYSLRLRKEYSYTWGLTPVSLHYDVDDKHYSATFLSLEELYKSPNIVLSATEQGQ